MRHELHVFSLRPSCWPSRARAVCHIRHGGGADLLHAHNRVVSRSIVGGRVSVLQFWYRLRSIVVSHSYFSTLLSPVVCWATSSSQGLYEIPGIAVADTAFEATGPIQHRDGGDMKTLPWECGFCAARRLGQRCLQRMFVLPLRHR